MSDNSSIEKLKKRKFQKALRAAICFVLCLSALLPCRLMQSTTAEAAGFANGDLGSVSFIEWRKVNNSEEYLPTDTNGNYYMYLMWWDWHNECWRYFSEGGSHNSYSKTGNIYDGSDVSKVFLKDSDTFLTSNPHGMPKITFNGYDGNKNNKNTGWRSYIIKLDEGNGEYIYNRSDYSDCMGFSSSSHSNWSVAVHDCGGNYANSADEDGTVCIYSEKSGQRDAGFMWNKRGNCYAEQDKDYDDFDYFYLWIGREVKYSVISNDYTVEAGKVLNIDDKVVIPENVTVTVEPGAVLSIEGQVFNNGKINNYGTLIVQENACLCPFDAKDFNLAGQINCYGNGYSIKSKTSGKTVAGEGNLIVMKNGKLATESGKGSIAILGGSLINYGITVVPDKLLLNNAYCENRGNLIVGYTITGLNSLKNSTVSGKGSSTTLQGGAVLGNVSATPGMSILDRLNYKRFDIQGKTSCVNYGNVHAFDSVSGSFTNYGTIG